MKTLAKDKKVKKKKVEKEKDYVYVAMDCGDIVGVFKNLERGINSVFDMAKEINCLVYWKETPDFPDVATCDVHRGGTKELFFTIHFTKWEVK